MDNKEDPFTLLMNIRDGCGETSNNLYAPEIEIQLDETNNSNFPLYDDGDSSKKLTKKTNVRSKKDVNPLSLEEQQEIEEPIEIDLRNICKTYGINPIDNTRQKVFRKDSNDILNFSIGEAYMKFAHGKDEEAINLLFEVIRMNPLNSEPYDALGDIYRKMGNYQKALEFYLLGIEFNKNDHKRWIELAEIACFNEMYKSASQFYSKAIKLSPKNVTYYIKKCNLLEHMKQFENAYKTYEKLLTYLEPEDYKIILSIAFRIANILDTYMSCAAEALNLIENIMLQHSVESTEEKFASFRLYLNTYLYLLLKNGHYLKVLRKLVKYNLIKIEGIDLATESDQDLSKSIKNYYSKHPQLMLKDEELDLKSKLVCVFVYLREMEFIEMFLPEFDPIEDPSTQESIYRPLVEAFIHIKNYDKAYKYVVKLVKHFKSSQYWYWCGMCLNNQSKLEESIEAYENAIKYDPNNYDAVNELSTLCNQIGNPERALENVDLDSRFNIDTNLLLNRCNLLFICKRWDEFIVNSELLLSTEMYFIQSFDDINELMARSLTLLSFVRASKTLRRRYSRKAALNKLIGGSLSVEQYFDVLKKSLFVLLNYTKQYDEAVRWAYSAYTSTFLDQINVPLSLILFRCLLDAKYRSYTFDLGKMLLKEFKHSGIVWYAFSAMMNDIYQDCRHKRYCTRLWNENPDNINVMLMNGHIALLSGRYKHALAIYLLVYRMKSDYRYDSFHVALCYLHLICQNHTLDKCSLFAQMMAFFSDYIQKIGKCQETYYNVARAFHLLGFYRHAVELYTVALNTPLKVHDKRFDLTPEVAFNMAQIYRHSGDNHKANQLISQYCTI